MLLGVWMVWGPPASADLLRAMRWLWWDAVDVVREEEGA